MLKIQEKILLYRIRHGDQTAFTRLCREYWEKIYQFVYFRISDREKVNDFTNEIFVKVLDYLIKGGEIKNFHSFLYQTTRNFIIDFYREKNKPEVSLEEVSEKDFEEKDDLGKEIDIKLDLQKIEKALRKIPDRYREIIILRFINGLPLKEISQITGESQTNVRQIASRGLKLLRKELIADNF